MKTLIYSTLLLALVFITAAMTSAQNPTTSSQLIDGMLGVGEDREELTRLKTGITTVLADPRLTDQPTRDMLLESKVVLTEMLEQRVGTNTSKLANLTKWMRAQGEAKIALYQVEGVITNQQQFILDNPLAGQETHLTSIARGILGVYVELDGENAGHDNLNSLLQLYFNHRQILERGPWLANRFLWKTPQWIQGKFPQMTLEQKRQFLKDVNTERNIEGNGPHADEEPGPPPTVQEQSAYDSAYQFIVANTPQP